MKKLEPNDPETRSSDLVAENIEQLKALFPELVTEGEGGASVNVDVLKQLVGDKTVSDCDEKYGLNWHGKRKARLLALTPSTGTLRPCLEESLDWDTTQNLMIEGDNLEVLKLLRKSYAGKVKLIYIDPPYNTGNDFVYPDNFQDNIRNYLELTGQVEERRKVSTNTESSGRFHTVWLNTIYPRLKVAKDLLRPDGVLFVTIDDTECSNLRMLLDEIFGTENFVATIAWKKRSSPDARDTIGSVHDWILCYVRDQARVKEAVGKMPLSKTRVEAYSNPDNDPRGEWASVDMTGMTGRATKDQYFQVLLPSGRTVGPPEGRSWGLAQGTFEELRADNRIWFGQDGDSVPRIKKFLVESDGQVVPSFWDSSEVGSNEEAKKEVNSLMDEPGVFDTPKPVRLIRRMIGIGTRSAGSDVVLDFFAGSATTGHAVAETNSEDSGDRRFILVQLPEPLDRARKDQRVAAEYCDKLNKPNTIAELTKERLRRAAAKIRKENPMFPGDLGFRVFKLDSTNIREWDPAPEDLDRSLFDATEHLRDDRSETDILYELLLKLGLDLCVPIERRAFADKDVHAVGGGRLFACLAQELSGDEVEEVAQGIVAWRKKLDPEEDSACVFRDSAFEDDVAKTNLTAILEQHGIENVRSL